jgi:hypothetical protein
MFNLKLSKYIDVFGYYTSSMNDCSEWKPGKYHEFTNIAQLQMTRIMMASVADIVKRVVFTNFRAAWFLLDRVYMCCLSGVFNTVWQFFVLWNNVRKLALQGISG